MRPENKQVIHVDMSDRWYTKKDSSISWRNQTNPKNHGGIFVSRELKTLLKKKLQIDFDYSRIHAITIYLLLRKEIANIERIVVCNDQKFSEVKSYLDILFEQYKEYSAIQVISIGEYRDETGRKRAKSAADNIAWKYRRLGNKNLRNHQLNLTRVDYATIEEFWLKIDKILKGR